MFTDPGMHLYPSLEQEILQMLRNGPDSPKFPPNPWKNKQKFYPVSRISLFLFIGKVCEKNTE